MRPPCGDPDGLRAHGTQHARCAGCGAWCVSARGPAERLSAARGRSRTRESDVYVVSTGRRCPSAPRGRGSLAAARNRAAGELGPPPAVGAAGEATPVCARLRGGKPNAWDGLRVTGVHGRAERASAAGARAARRRGAEARPQHRSSAMYALLRYHHFPKRTERAQQRERHAPAGAPPLRCTE